MSVERAESGSSLRRRRMSVLRRKQLSSPSFPIRQTTRLVYKRGIQDALPHVNFHVKGIENSAEKNTEKLAYERD